MTHYIAHQQALVKDNICIAVLVFNDHDESLMQETFSRFEYDSIVDLCILQKDASINSVWDGFSFNAKPHQSWTLGDDLNWHPPVDKPGEGYVWNEETLSWQTYNN